VAALINAVNEEMARKAEGSMAAWLAGCNQRSTAVKM